MKKTSINLSDNIYSQVDNLSERLGEDRSTTIRSLLQDSLNRNSNKQTFGVSGPHSRRLTESAKFVSTPQDPVAFSYAGALHHLEQEKMISLATQLYSQNPLAHRLIEIVTNFCVGNNITWESDNKDTEEFLTQFWYHTRNSFDKTQPQRVSELLLYGEQCYPIFTNPKNGLLQLGNIHPAYIKQTILDPDDYKLVIGVEVYNTATKTTTYKTAFLEDDDEFLNDRAIKLRKQMDGECFYFAINASTLPMIANGFGERQYQNRGRSEGRCQVRHHRQQGTRLL